MSSVSQFVARSVESTSNLNWVFVVDWIIIVLAALILIFYFNRLVGKAINWFLSPIIWKRYKVRIKVQAFKISFLTARVFLKNVVIITKDEMLVVYQATLTWRYWFWKTKKNQYDVHHQRLNQIVNQTLPSRFLLEISGCEIFVYNRSVAHELIAKSMREASQEESVNTSFEKDSFTEASLRQRKAATDSVAEKNFNQNFDQSSMASGLDALHLIEPSKEENVPNFILKVLPVDIRISKGSLIIGNDTTPYLHVGFYKEMRGTMDASIAGDAQDPFRILYDLKFKEMKLDFRRNITYNEESVMTPLPPVDKPKNDSKKHHYFFSSKLKHFGEAVFSPLIKNAFKHPHIDINSDIESTSDWKGLKRYMREFESLDSFEWESIYEKKLEGRTEYAKESTFLTAEFATLTYYYDIPGLVPDRVLVTDQNYGPDVGNSGPAPKFGADITFGNAKITYGPWANKQRGEIQQMLFPTMYADAKIQEKLKTNDYRIHTSFDLQIDFIDDAVFRIPFREESKEESVENTQELRYGWIDIRFGGGSSLDMIAPSIPNGNKGFQNSFSAKMIKPEITTSVNGTLLFKADKHFIEGDVGYPLEWQGLAKWSFKNKSHNSEFHLLREHVALISDLVGDFGSGPLTPIELFRPFMYHIQWDFQKYALYLNINEENIIDNPIDHKKNRFLSFKGDDFKLNVNIPMLHLHQKSNLIDFTILTSYFLMSVEHQEWSTYSEFGETEEVGYAGDFKVDASYNYYNVIESGAVDTIVMNCTCNDTTLKAYGFVVKYFMDLKENYFGNLIHFKTYEEYTQRKKEHKEFEGLYKVGTSLVGNIDGIPVQTLESVENNNSNPYKKTKNETDLMLSFCVDNGCIVLPCNLYNSRSHIALHFDDLDIDLRNTNYYMDIQADFSEIKGRYIQDSDESIIFTNTKGSLDFKPDIFIDGLSIHGLRIFGLPPCEPTYFCRWTFDTDGILIESEPNFLGALTSAVHSFGIGNDDFENSLGITISPVMDILNFDFRTPFIKIQINSPQNDINEFQKYVFNLILDCVSFNISDQPTTDYNSVMNLIIEKINATSFVIEEQIFDLSTNLKLTNLCQKKNGFHRMLQQSLHLNENDGPFHRTPWLIPEFLRDRAYYTQYGKLHESIYTPRVPIPLNSQTAELFINTLPPDVKVKFEQTTIGGSRISSATTEKFNHLYDIDSDEASDHGEYASDYNKPTDSVGCFRRLSDLNPDCEYDNITIEMDKFLTFFSPKLLVILVDIASKVNDISLSKVLDQLQIEYFIRIKKKLENTVLNLNYSCDMIDIFISEKIGDNNGISLRSQNTNVIFKHKTTRTKESLAVQCDIERLNFDIFNNRKTMIAIELYELGFSYIFKDVKSILIKLTDLNFDIKLANLNWVVEYISSFGKCQTILKIKQTELKQNRRKAKIEILYQLTMVGVDKGISYEPQCLNAVWNQSKKDSIRRDKNWKLLPRLRHVLNSIPEEWRAEKEELFKQQLWDAPMDAEDRLQNFFANIRTWEKSPNDILEMVFGTLKNEELAPYHNVDLWLNNLQLKLLPFEDAIQIYDLKFSSREGILAKEVSDTAYPLLDTHITNSLEISLEIKQLLTNFSNIKMYSNELLQSIENVLLVMQQIKKDQTVDDLDSTKSVQNLNISKEQGPYLITLETNIDYFKHLLSIDKSALTIQGTDTKLVTSLVKTDKLLSFSLNFLNSYFNVAFDVDSLNIFEYQLKRFSVAVVNTKPFEDGDLVIVVDHTNAELYIDLSEGDVTKLLDTIIYNEYAIIKELIDHSKTIDALTEKSVVESSTSSLLTEANSLLSLSDNIFSKFGLKFTFIFNFETFSTDLSLVQPLKSYFNLNNVVLTVKYNSEGLSSLLSIKRIGAELKSNAQKYLSGFIREFSLGLKVSYFDDVYMLILDTVLSEARLNLNHNDLIKSARSLQSDVKILMLNIDKIKDKFKEISESMDVTETKDDNNFSIMDNTSVLIKKVKKYIRAEIHSQFHRLTTWALINGNSIQFDTSEINLELYTYDKILQRTSPFGQLFIPSMKVNALLHGSHGSAFTMIDLQLGLGVENSDDIKFSRQKLFVKSEFFRLAFNNQLLCEAIEAYGQFGELFDISYEPVSSNNDMNNLEMLESISRFFSVAIEADNVCIGWILDIHDYMPGPIIGFENAKLLCNDGAGDISMGGMYFSIAHGPTTDSFFPKESELLSNNRMYFPGFQMNYSLQRRKDLLVCNSKLTGDRVDFKLQTDIFDIGKSILISVNHLEDQFVRVKNKLQGKRKDRAANPVAVEKVQRAKNSSTMISCDLQFAGAAFLIENQYYENNGKASSLYLTAPTLSLAVDYKHDILSLKRHNIIIAAHIGETQNELYCTCLPVIVAIVKSFRGYMRDINDKAKLKAQIPSNIVNNSANGINFVSFSEKFNLNFDLKISPQKLILNCDPLAQIEAEVHLKGIGIHLTTEHDFSGGIFVVDEVGAELKHAFSKAISGSVGLNGFILNSMLTTSNSEKQITTVGSVNDISGYINIQQLQDLDVFKDLWFPGELYDYDSDKNVNLKIGNKKTFDQLLMEVRTNSPLPWIVIFFIKRIKAVIDLGSSLGSLNLEIDRFKTKSTRLNNWDHELEILTNFISLSTSGKVDSLIIANGFKLETYIRYKDNENFLKLPVIILELNIQEIKSKLGIDFHTFCLIDGEGISVKLSNEYENRKLTGKFNLNSFRIMMTAMMASNFVEIYSIILRISQNLKISYKQTLKLQLEDADDTIIEENWMSGESEEDVASLTFYSIMQSLPTELFINIANFETLVFPSSLSDKQGVSLKIGSLDARFLQYGLENEVELKLTDFYVSLVTFHKRELMKEKEGMEYFTFKSCVDDYILIFPHLKISMMTEKEEQHPNDISYTYECKFGDKIDIKWKLGSVYFIHQMWISHATTLKERLSFLRIHSNKDNFNEENYKESIIASVNFEDKLKDLERDEKFQYLPLKKVDIETPKLKDLGDATPPLEWFGLHRDKFPQLTHRFIILSLNKSVKGLQEQYSRILK